MGLCYIIIWHAILLWYNFKLHFLSRHTEIKLFFICYRLRNNAVTFVYTGCLKNETINQTIRSHIPIGGIKLLSEG